MDKINNSKKHIEEYFKDISKISHLINLDCIQELIIELKFLRENNGRLFCIGVGGSAANCSHAVNDFRNLCEIEAYAANDNVSELTANINDKGWDNSFKLWLKNCHFNSNDAIFVMSVGGGNLKKNVSVNIVKAVDYALDLKAKIFGIVGKKNGYVCKKGNCVVIVPEVNIKLITPYSESYQSIIWHCLVSSPELQRKKTKW